MLVVSSTFKVKMSSFALKPDVKKSVWKGSFWNVRSGGRGCEGCLQAAWYGLDLEGGGSVLPQPPVVPDRILWAPSPVAAQVIAIPRVVPLPFHSPLLSIAMLSLPFLPCRPTTVACNKFFFNTISISRLNPAGAIVGSFHVSPLLSSIISSCKIPTHPTQPAHSLLCAGFILQVI